MPTIELLYGWRRTIMTLRFFQPCSASSSHVGVLGTSSPKVTLVAIAHGT